MYANCESSGYAVGFDMMTGEDHQKKWDHVKRKNPRPVINPTNELGKLTRQVLGHLDELGYLDKGFVIFMDNHYSSPELYEELLYRNTFACGTCMDNRIGFPTALKKPPKGVPLKQGEVNIRRLKTANGSILALRFEDKKAVCLLSTFHLAKRGRVIMKPGKLEVLEKRKKRHEEEQEWLAELAQLAKQNARRKLNQVQKQRLRELRTWKKEKKRAKKVNITTHRPLAVVDYNNHMLGVDVHDQLVEQYEFLRPTKKWTKKVTTWIFQSLLVNSYILFRKFGEGASKVSHFKYRQRIVLHLVQNKVQYQPIVEQPRVSAQPAVEPEERLKAVGNHFPIMNSETTKRKAAWVNCVACNLTKTEAKSKGIKPTRQTTRYSCEECGVALCLEPCFKIYHKEKDFRAKCIPLQLQKQQQKQLERDMEV